MQLKIRFILIFIAFFWLNCNAQQLQKEQLSNLNYIVKEGRKGGNLLILIHGYGSNERDLFSFANRFPKTTVVCVRAPIVLSENSYSWYTIQFSADGNHSRNLNQALQSEAMLLQFTKALKNKYHPSKTVIGGFSQGAIMSAKIALTTPELIDGFICISGMLLTENLAPIPSLFSQYKQLKGFYGHGTEDTILSIEKGRKCKSVLRSAGIALTDKEYPIRHEISLRELNDIVKWYYTQF